MCCEVLSDFLLDFLYILCSIWHCLHSIWHVCCICILTYILANNLTLNLTFCLTCFLAFCLTSSLTYSAVLSDTYSVFVSGEPQSARVRLAPDCEVAAETKSRAPGRWGKIGLHTRWSNFRNSKGDAFALSSANFFSPRQFLLSFRAHTCTHAPTHSASCYHIARYCRTSTSVRPTCTFHVWKRLQSGCIPQAAILRLRYYIVYMLYIIYIMIIIIILIMIIKIISVIIYHIFITYIRLNLHSPELQTWNRLISGHPAISCLLSSHGFLFPRVSVSLRFWSLLHSSPLIPWNPPPTCVCTNKVSIPFKLNLPISEAVAKKDNQFQAAFVVLFHHQATLEVC